MFKKILLLLSLCLSANANEIYNVKSIKIAASNKNASVARNIAIEKGQLKAFHILVKQHFPEAIDNLSSLKEDAILNTVAGFELADEKRSATNYLAKINVKFSKFHVDTLMNNIGAKFHQKAPRKEEDPLLTAPLPKAVTSPTIVSLVIPVFEQETQIYWLDEENDWLNLWNKHPLETSNAKDKFILPVLDLEDLNIINKHILNKNIIDLSPLLEKYNVNNIALVKLKKLDNPSSNHLTLQINYIGKFHSSWQHHNFKDLEGEDLNALLNRAYLEIQNFNFNEDQNALAKNKFPTIKPNNIIIDFPITNFSDWLSLEKILTNSEYITKLEIKNMNLKQYKISFNYNISLLDLQTLFTNHNLELQENGANNFTLIKESSNEEY